MASQSSFFIKQHSCSWRGTGLKGIELSNLFIHDFFSPFLQNLNNNGGYSWMVDNKQKETFMGS